MAKRQAYLQHLAAVPMFHACSKKELDLIARHAEEFRFPAGEQIVVEGEIGLEFYVIMEGTAKVTRHGVQLATLGPGDFFGELALLDHARRNATVEALTPLVAVVLARREFDGLMAEAPAVTHKLLVGMARRLHELDAHV
jgi:CRP-like cAMP-binding protein